MTSQPGKQTITINILLNISQSKDHVIERNKITISFKNHAENEAGRLVPDLFLIFKKALHEVKASGLRLRFNIFR